MTKWQATLHRALRTLIQSAASSALVAIGNAATIGEVNWTVVASTAALSAIISALMCLAGKLPEESDIDVSTGHPA